MRLGRAFPIQAHTTAFRPPPPPPPILMSSRFLRTAAMFRTARRPVVLFQPFTEPIIFVGIRSMLTRSREVKLFIAFRSPLTGAALTARVDGVDLNPNVTSIVYSTAAPGGFQAMSVGYERMIHFPGERQEWRRFAGLQRQIEFAKFVHVELYDATRLVWEGRVMLRNKPGGIASAFTAQGYGFTGLKDGVYRNKDTGKATVGVILAQALASAAPIIQIPASDQWTDPGVMATYASFDGKQPFAIVDQIVKAGDVLSKPVDYVVYERREMQLKRRTAPSTPDYQVSFDDTVTWNEQDDACVGTVVLDYTSQATGATKRIIVTEPTFSDANNGFVRSVAISGGTMSDPMANQFALTHLAGNFDSQIACTIERKDGRPLETPGGGGRPPHLVRAGEWVQVGQEAMLMIVRTNHDMNSKTHTYELGTPEYGFAQRFENLRETQGHVIANSSPATGAPWVRF